VPADWVLPHHVTFEGPQLHSVVAQLLHAAIDAGIGGEPSPKSPSSSGRRAAPGSRTGTRSPPRAPSSSSASVNSRSR
jgi:hypothetical protein